MSSTNNVREIRTSLSLDGETAFRKSLNSVDSSLSAMKSELKAVSTSFDVSTDKMAANQKKAEILQKMQEQLKVKTSALSDAVETSTKAYEEAKSEFYNCLRMVPFTLGFSLYFAFHEWRPIMKEELRKERAQTAV